MNNPAASGGESDPEEIEALDPLVRARGRPQRRFQRDGAGRNRPARAECLAIRVARRLNSYDVIETLADAMLLYGIPEHIRSDNGPEFVATKLRKWLSDVGAKTRYIEPGSPWENGYCESFNGKLRDECLNGEIFYSLKEARIVIEQWRVQYNTLRPHSSLGYRPPAPVAIQPVKQQGHGDMEDAARFPHLHTPGDDCGQRTNEALH